MREPEPNTVRRIGLKDIAAHVNVSTGSVSSVLKNLHLERRIPQATADKIRKAAAELGYLPNINARSLRNGAAMQSTMVLALITSFEAPLVLINHFAASLHRAAEQGAGHLPFALMIEMFSAGKLENLPGLLSGDRFNAAIIFNTVTEDDQFLARNYLPYPVILVNRSIPGYSSVAEHPDTGIRAAEILVGSGRSNPAVLHGTPLTQSTQNRVYSFMRRVSKLLHRPATEIIGTSLSETGGYDAMRIFLEEGGKCDAIYAVSDALALGAYRAIKERGLSIPEDISVLGVGDYEIGPFFDPPLSSVGVSYPQIADEASHLLLERLQRGKPAPRQISLPLLEVLRSSTQ